VPVDRDVLAVTGAPGEDEERRAAAEAEPDRPVLLVLRALGLGDLLTGVPSLRGLRRAFPGHRLVLAAPASLAPLLPLIGGVDGLLDVRGLGPIPAYRPHIAVNLHGRGPRSIAALLAVRPQRLLSHAHPAFPGVLGPRWPDRVHEVRRWCAMLAWHGVSADPADLRIAAPRTTPFDSPDRPVVIHPGASAGGRRWPAERFAEVATALRRDGHPIVVTGNGTERDLARRVAASAGLPDGAVLAGRTRLAELAGVVAHARLVISGDTGVAHLATALETPSVVLCGPVSPELWGPPSGSRRHVALWAGESGDPHAAEPGPGLLKITVRQVLDAARDRLEVGIR